MACICKHPVAGFLVSIFILLISLSHVSCAGNAITLAQPMIDGESLISVQETFELRFFSPENSSFRYVGIWYYNVSADTPVWVANRENPVSDRNGVFRIGSDGNLMVLSGNGTVVWSSNAQVLSNSTAAILLDNGNLVLSSNESIGDLSNAYWQSFNHPTDTFLPGMRVRVSTQMGENYAFTSWKSPNDPSPGNFTLGIDPSGGPQIVIWDQGERIWRSGQFDNTVFNGVPGMIYMASSFRGFKLTQPEADGSMYFTYSPPNPSDLLRFRISWNGIEEQLLWDEASKEWTVRQSEPSISNKCERYNHCGNFGVCNNSTSRLCKCLEGFKPRFPDRWSDQDWSGGCERKEKLQCQGNSTEAIGNSEPDEFRLLTSVKLPDSADVSPLQSPDACRERCLQNCSCSAYANITGIGCMIWTGDMVDIQQFEEGGALLFLRIAHSESGGGKTAIFLILIIVLVGLFLLVISLWLLWRFKIMEKVLRKGSSNPHFKNTETQACEVNKSEEFSADLSRATECLVDGNNVNGHELPLFNFFNVAAATNNFSEGNKLGQGGFGIVYKGEFSDGQKIAVKRLSGKSSQGLDEFKNEIILIQKLQHRNLVRLLGCCIHGEENMLLYEYMSNKSLDFSLFDETKRAKLDWRKRFTIIEGIARGLLYLHRDSRLRIIHRDLKASNILLDEELNPKISDFGMARMFGGSQNEENTLRVVGTYGYMSPEYAMEGLFSVKSDVYSFGVLLLEIVCGRRNTSFRTSECGSLISHAWQLWTEDKAIEMVDPSIQDTCSANEVLKCIHIGLLCVQDSALHRPSMSSVMLMLESENPTLPMPRQPTFTSMRASVDAEICTESANHLTVTMVVGR